VNLLVKKAFFTRVVSVKNAVFWPERSNKFKLSMVAALLKWNHAALGRCVQIFSVITESAASAPTGN